MFIRKPRYTLDRFHRVHALILSVLLMVGGNLVVCGPAGWANDEIRTQILSGQDALYHGNFEEARHIFTSLTQAYPDDPKGYFFLALTYRWLTRIDPESAQYQKHFEQAAEKAISVAQALRAKDATQGEALLYLAATYGYRAEYNNFLKNRWDKAYDDAVKMREYLEKAEKFSVSEQNIDAQLGYGLYNYYAYFYRAKIGWWRFLLSLPSGDKQKGIEQIQRVRAEGTYLKVEAWYFLVDIYKKDKEFAAKAVPLCEQLHQTYPAHPFFYIFLAGLYHQHRDWNNSLRTAFEILERAQTNTSYSRYIISQAKYLVGESSFFLGQYQEALRQFDEIIAAKPSEPDYLLPWSHLRRGAIYDLTGKKNEAAAEYKLVLQMEDVLQVHDLAEGLLKNQKKRQ